MRILQLQGISSVPAQLLHRRMIAVIKTGRRNIMVNHHFSALHFCKSGIEQHYCCSVDVMPILLSFEDYEKQPDAQTVEEFGDGKTNIIFTGRIAPAPSFCT